MPIFTKEDFETALSKSDDEIKVLINQKILEETKRLSVEMVVECQKELKTLIENRNPDESEQEVINQYLLGTICSVFSYARASFDTLAELEDLK